MNRRPVRWLLAIVCVVGACAKSPIDPAGAITITAPVPTFPPNGAQIATAAQPITLTVHNAVTGDPGAAMIYTFEVAGDKTFGSKIVTKDIEQGVTDTSLKLDTLPGSRQYFWRVRAAAGGTLGTFTDPASFSLTSASPAALPRPTPAFPPTGSTVTSTRPTLTIDNSPGVGSATITYWFEIATDAAFTKVVASGGTQASEGTTQTSFTPPSALSFNTTYYWHARALDLGGGSSSSFSTTATFVTPSGS